MRRPRSDVVLRRFLAGESVEEIRQSGPGKWHGSGSEERGVFYSRWFSPAWSEDAVEAALRRGWLRMEARARQKRGWK